MNVFLTGTGGREHALAWKLAQSPDMGRLLALPGNPGIAEIAEVIDVTITDHDAVIDVCREQRVDLVVIGPEAPLVAGLADDLVAAGIVVFGPSKAAARLEGSKGFTKDLCARHSIPTAAYGRFDTAAAAKSYVRAHGTPIVVKADGLAAGKGVIIGTTIDQAEAAIDACFEGAFGTAGGQIVVEEFLHGEEASLFVLSDGKHILPLAGAQDHKQVGEGDTGPNTGGMGAYSPAPVLTPELVDQVIDTIIRPTVSAMAQMGAPFRGVLYAGLMITATGPQLIEYNVRFGDPECQALMMRLEGDLLPLLYGAATGALPTDPPRWRDLAAICVVLASEGYPGAYGTGDVIGNLAVAGADPAVQIFHAGTRSEHGRIVAAGGRVLNVCALGDTVRQARDRAYGAIDQIDWPGGFCRRDIGWRAIGRG
jgi:phosphoribosylamine--glycine ligase